jgi:hypothetical protein
MREFTPVPWRYQAETKEVVYHEDGYEFVICGLSHMRTENANLTGELIAAAPELYEACEQALVNDIAAEGENASNMFPALRKKLEAALKKARGE